MDGHNRVLYKQKHKAVLIGVLTLGFAGLTLFGMGWTWRKETTGGAVYWPEEFRKADVRIIVDLLMR